MTPLQKRLDRLLENADRSAHLASDPVSFVHRYEDAADREVVGLIASSLAFGNVVAVRRSVQRVLDALGDPPARAIDVDPRTLRRRLRGFVHRVYRGEHLATVLSRAARIRREQGSLGEALATHVRASDFREALARLADDLRGARATDRGLRHLVPDPRAGSACKRLLLYARWMARPADGVDLGQWPLAPSLLVMPVDTHIQRIAHNVGLTERTDASWRTAEEITAALRRFDPLDPVKYDFALCHLGISGACPSRRDESLCAACVLRPSCRHWG